MLIAAAGVDDYTYLWWDLRPHPNLGTVEVRVMDAQTRVEDTAALAALVQSLVRLHAEGTRRPGGGLSPAERAARGAVR